MTRKQCKPRSEVFGYLLSAPFLSRSGNTGGSVHVDGVTMGRIAVYPDQGLVDVLASEIHAPVQLQGFAPDVRLMVNGES